MPSYPCVYFKLNTEIAHLFLSDTTALSWKGIAWKGASLTSVLLVFYPMIVLGLQYSYTALILEKKKKKIWLGFVFLFWAVVGKQVSDYYSNIWKLLEIKNQISSLKIEGLIFSVLIDNSGSEAGPGKCVLYLEWITVVSGSHWDKTLATEVVRYI